MKQGVRLIARPGAFFNQLQWSKHHSYILFTFLLISAIEAQVGKQHALYQSYAALLSQGTGLGFDVSLWLVVAAKIALLLVGSFLISTSLWMIGNLFGQKNSRRVLARRLAIVFTVAIAAYTASHLEHLFPWMGTASFFLFFWALLLGYFALREQFLLTHLETVFVGGLAILMVVSSWQGANRFLETSARKAFQEIAAKPTASVPQRVKPKY